MVETTLSTSSSGTTTSIFTLGRKSTVYSEPRYSSVWPFCRPKPRTSVTVIPITPISVRASLTSSSLNGLMIASICFMPVSSRYTLPRCRSRAAKPRDGRGSGTVDVRLRIFEQPSDFFKDGNHEGRDVRADALEVGEDVEVDLGGVERFGQPGAEPAQVRLAQLALALSHHRTLVEHLLGQGPIAGGRRRDGGLEVLGHHAVVLEDLRPARVGEVPGQVELLPGQLHEVLVDDVADVLQVADER